MKFQVLVPMTALAAILSGCAHTLPTQTLAYAPLKDHRTFEYEFPVVWKGIEESLRKWKVAERDPDEVTDTELKKLEQRTLLTDWIYGQSRDKYITYKVNDSIRTKYLQTRFRYHVTAKRSIGGTDVNVATEEEIERLHEDGSSAGYEKAESPDTSRPNELLDRIGNSIMGALPPSDNL